MIGFSIWLIVLAAAGLMFPRRPRLSGALFILLGLLSTALQLVARGNLRPNTVAIALGVAGVWFAIGIRQVRRVRV